MLKHIEVDKNEQTRSLPAIGSRNRNKLEKFRLDSATAESKIIGAANLYSPILWIANRISGVGVTS